MRFRGLILMAGSIAALACGGDDGGTGPPGNGGDPPDNQVQVRNNNFNPSALQVEAGTTVTWVWASGGTVHNVTFDDAVASGNLGTGSFPRTFSAAGSFPYHCTIHGSAMSGVVNVVAAAGGDTGGDGGDGGDGGGGGPY